MDVKVNTLQKELQKEDLGNQAFRDRNKSRKIKKINEFDSKVWLVIKLLKLTTKDEQIVKQKVSRTIENLEQRRRKHSKQLDEGRERAYGWLFNSVLPSTISLRSERGFDYKKLRDYLDAGRWQEADSKTSEIIQELISVEYSPRFWISEENTLEFWEKKFPCEDLRTIDRLWCPFNHCFPL